MDPPIKKAPHSASAFLSILLLPALFFFCACGKETSSTEPKTQTAPAPTTPKTKEIITDFVTRWKTTTAEESISLSLPPGYNYDFTVDWGDNSPVAEVTSDADVDTTHAYKNPGTYEVVIKGTLEAWKSAGFGNCDNLIEVVSLGNMGWIDLTHAFTGCTNLTSFAGGDTSKVTSMAHMFRHTHNLTKLDLSSFDTSNVTNMISMFHGVKSAETLDVSSFDTSKARNMSFMFFKMESLKTLDLGNFDTSQIAYMNYMFADMHSLTSLNLRSFDTSKVVDMSYMFFQTSSLPSLDLRSFDTPELLTTEKMFMNTSNLASVDLRNFNTAKVRTTFGMFSRADSLTNLDLQGWDVSNATDMRSMFFHTISLEELDATDWVISNNNPSTVDTTGIFVDAGLNVNGGMNLICNQPGNPSTLYGETCQTR